jgi:hypothetical protein
VGPRPFLGRPPLPPPPRPAPAARHLLVGFDGRTRVLEGCLSVLDDAGDLASVAARLKKAWREPVDPSDDVLRLGMILRTLTSESAPASLLLIVRRAVARVPDERQRSARHLAREIEALLVSARMVVTADDVARFMRQVFADRLERHEARLRAAQHTTEIFRRKAVSIELTDADFEEVAPDAERQPESFIDYYDAGDTMLMPTEVMRRRSLKLKGARRRQALEPVVERGAPVSKTEPMELPPPPQPLPSSPAARLAASLVPPAPARPSSAFSPKWAPAPGTDVGVWAPTFDAPAAYTAPAPAVVRSVAPPVNAIPTGRSSLWMPLVMILVGAFAAAAFWFTRTHPETVARFLGANRASATHPVVLAAPPAAARPAAPPVAGSSAPAQVPTIAPPVASASASSRVAPAVDVLSLPEAPPPRSSSRSHRLRPHGFRPQAPAPAPESAAAPEAEAGMLTVVCVPACDNVLDGGRSLGPSPVFKVPAAAGAHTLTLQGEATQKSVTVVVKPESVAFVRVELP